jgi:epoxyqueuosine reductase
LPVTKSSLKQKLWREAQQLGFNLMRVCAPDAAMPQASNHRKWLERGHGADMRYLYRNPEARYDARSLLPECRSVVVVALSYYHDHPKGRAPAPIRQDPPVCGPAQGPAHAEASAKVAMYAWGDNYHNVIRPKLKHLGRWLDTQVPDHRWRGTVDSAPLAEKAFAVAAGVGWLGRNSLVINPELGTYFFIACLLTSAELPFDDPLQADCGTCTLCIKECPTEALLGPGILAAERCVSYHNTESQGEPGNDTALNGWLFGCDTCQRVCPFNDHPVPTAEPRFSPRPGILELNGTTAAAIGEEEFRRRFEGTSLRRRKYHRFHAAAEALLHQARLAVADSLTQSG